MNIEALIRYASAVGPHAAAVVRFHDHPSGESRRKASLCLTAGGRPTKAGSISPSFDWRHRHTRGH